MKRSILPVVLLLALLAACSDSEHRKPDARLLLTVRTEESWARTPAIVFTADPLDSRDDKTAREDLEVRFDFEADGTWDTEFEPLRCNDCFLPDPLPTRTWRARIQVRDEDGNLDVAEAETSLPDWVPAGPDIIAAATDHSATWWSDGRLIYYKVNIWDAAWQVPKDLEIVYEFRVDGVPVGTVTGKPGPLVEVPCACRGEPGGVGRPYNALEVTPYLGPGTHEIEIVADATDLVDEVDETNNSVIHMVTVGAGRSSGPAPR